MRVLTIDLTKKCNNRCIHCRRSLNSKTSTSDTAHTFEISELKEIINDARELGVTDVFLSGGEPLLYDKLFELLDFLLEKRVYVSILTSAPYADSNFFEKLSTYPNLVQLRISIESTEPELLDFIRNSEKNYGRICRFIDYLRAAGIFFGISSTINSLNFPELSELLDFAIIHKANYFRVSPYIGKELPEKKTDESRNALPDISVDTKELLKSILTLLSKRLKYLRSSYYPFESDFSNFESYFEASCPALSHSSYIYKENGIIKAAPCPFVAEQSFNVSKLGFKEATSRLSKKLEKISEKRSSASCLLGAAYPDLSKLFDTARSIVLNAPESVRNNLLLVLSIIISRQVEIFNTGYNPCWRSSPFFLYPLQQV